MSVTFSYINTVDVSCYGYNDGIISASASGGGGGPYEYTIDSTWTYSNTFYDLYAGTYSLRARDNKLNEVMEIVEIYQPSEVIVTEELIYHIDDDGSGNGQFVLNTTGGTPDYYYSLLNDGSTQSGSTFSGLTANSYHVEAIDSSGCSNFINVDIKSSIYKLELTEDYVLEVDCFGTNTGEIGINVDGGTQPYNFTINGGGLTQSFRPYIVFSDLYADDYLIEVEDALGYTASIVVTVSEPPKLILELVEIINPICHDGTGSIEVQSSGGTGTHQYRISGGDWVPSPIFTNLSANNYLIEVIDENDCMESLIASIIAPDELIISEILNTHKEAECGKEDGQFEVIAIGGTEPYTFILNGDLIQDNGFFQNLPAGVYDVQVIDANGCSKTLDTIIKIIPYYKTLKNGINIYINKKWKNVLIHINIEDNILPNLSNHDRDSLYTELYAIIAASNFTNAINDISNKYGFFSYIKYIIINEDLSREEYSYDSNITELPHILVCETPDEILVRNNSLKTEKINVNIKPNIRLDNSKITVNTLNYFNNVPIAYKIDKDYNLLNTKVYNYVDRNINYFNIYRFSGYYSPIFYDIQLFSKDHYNKKIGNYIFDTTLTDFAMMKERKIRKINRKGSILKLKNSKTDNSIYPMIDEYGYTFIDFMIFKSTFDMNYHYESVENKERFINNNIQTDTDIEVGQPNDFKLNKYKL